MEVINGGRVPIKSWCEDPEQEVIDQARDLAALPSVFRQVCLMPDAHSGYGMPIGGVVALSHTVIPNAVGVDIGCGVCARRTSLTSVTVPDLKAILGGIRRRVPTGFSHHTEPQDWEGFSRAPDLMVIRRELNSARFQMGTLGGGNHFIEIQHGSDGHVWVMVHSGSRNFGYKIAKEYNRIAQALNRRRFPRMPQYAGEGGLAFLPDDAPEFADYIAAMNFALEFARENRLRMMRFIREAFADVRACEFDPPSDIHHNYAACERHFGHDVWVHRKGAISARRGQTGLIPGSQGTSSFLVRGKGHPESFCSCSHGAGRLMSRARARKTLDLASERHHLEELGILHSLRTRQDLDEASSAYKNIDQVIRQQKDLVEPILTLHPLAVIKG